MCLWGDGEVYFLIEGARVKYSLKHGVQSVYKCVEGVFLKLLDPEGRSLWALFPETSSAKNDLTQYTMFICVVKTSFECSDRKLCSVYHFCKMLD